MAKRIPIRRQIPQTAPRPADYRHSQADSRLRPEIGAQPQFRQRRRPAEYRYDSSLAPELRWDGQNPAREEGEAHIRAVQEGARAARERLAETAAALRGRGEDAQAEALEAILTGDLARVESAAGALRALSQPFINWAGKAERLSFEVPTLPLFVHERLSTQAILETLKGHRRERQLDLFELYGERDLPLAERMLRAYEHTDGWVNRLILGDSLVVMNSLLHYESLGGQVQTVYMDPPYGVKFGSNFQPFVRKRDVTHNDDEQMTREPEMVKAYRDTWELGGHSYLTYLRDRFLLARELLTPSGSLFVQIDDARVHQLRAVLDEVFGAENCCATVTFTKTSSSSGSKLASVYDFLLWYAKDATQVKYRQLYLPRSGQGWVNYDYVKLADGTHRRMTPAERKDWSRVPPGATVYRRDNLTSQRPAQQGDVRSYPFQGRSYTPGKGTFKTDYEGLKRLEAADRLEAYGSTLSYRRYATDFPFIPLTNQWTDTLTGGYAETRYYVVQTIEKVVKRCILMTSDPGDLVLDPTCGSGTTPVVAEEWGRRWIAIDTSRVPMALARQRLLTRTYPYYRLRDPERGPAAGFVFEAAKNKKGEHIGGIVTHITLQSIANGEPPIQEVLVDRPDPDPSLIRVTGPFCVEGTIPAPIAWDEDAQTAPSLTADGDYLERMLEVLRHSPLLHLGGGRVVELKSVRRPAKTLSLSAEALVSGLAKPDAPSARRTVPDLLADRVEEPGAATDGEPVAIVFGPENGAVTQSLVFEAAREAQAKGYRHLYVIGFAIQPNARDLVEKCEPAVGIAATYVQATPDLMMGDLLKNLRTSQIFSVCGLPEIRLFRSREPDGAGLYQVELLGLDVFDPANMQNHHRAGDDVPAWFLDTDYNGMVFHVSQAFFPRTGAWNAIKTALRGELEDSVWEHLAGTVSAPFEAGTHGRIAVKAIDDRGNELLVERALKEAER